MKNLFLALLCCIATGCASLPPPQSWNRSNLEGLDKVSVAERQALFQKLSISEIKAGNGKMDGTWYDIPTLEEACEQIQAKQAARSFHRASTEKIFRNSAPFVTLVLFTGIGAIAKVVLIVGSIDSESSGNNFIENDHPNQLISPLALAIGATVGLVAGSLEYWLLQRSMSDNMQEGSLSYNAKLKDILQLEVAPLPGGATAGVDMRF